MKGEKYSGFVFIPADLAEEVDLDLERKKEILFHHAHLADWNHWEILGLAWNAPVDAVRTAYLEKVKVFHPDRYGGKNLGSFRGRLEQVFRRMTEAKDLLGDAAKREEYARRTAPPEEFARLEARRLQDEQRAQERRARLARSNPLVARMNRVSELVERGRRAMEEGRFAQGANDFLTAAGLDPRAAEARTLAEEARKRLGEQRAQDAFERGLAAEAVSNAPVALASFLEAVAADPSNARYAVHAARVSLAAGDLASARQLADSAVRSGPRHAPAHEVLGLVLAAEGLQREAKRSLERALELDPNLETARSQLKKLRWSFLG